MKQNQNINEVIPKLNPPRIQLQLLYILNIQNSHSKIIICCINTFVEALKILTLIVKLLKLHFPCLMGEIFPPFTIIFIYSVKSCRTASIESFLSNLVL